MLSKLDHATGTGFVTPSSPEVAEATVMDGVSTSLAVTSIFFVLDKGSIFSVDVATRASCGACAWIEPSEAAKAAKNKAMQEPRTFWMIVVMKDGRGIK